MIYIVYLMVFFTGATVGSFLNVLVSRSVVGRDWVKGRSACEYCRKPLAWYDMIPVLSYLVYGGKSRCCKKKLSWQHPIVESLTGIMFVWWVAMGSYFFHLVSEPLIYVQPSFWLLMGIIFTVIVVADYYYGVIPTYAVYGGILLTLLYRLILIKFGEYRLIDLGISSIAMVISALFFQILRWITKGKGMGDGDVVLALLLGFLLSYPRSLVAIWVSFVIGGVIGVMLLVTKKKQLKTTLPFGPFMVLGMVVALMWGAELWRRFLP